jgi:hypothetical protein
MTGDQVKEILDRVLTWPAERQADAARVLTEMEQQDASPYHLTDEQLAELNRRLSEPKSEISHASRSPKAPETRKGRSGSRSSET